jgi:hypothetical protein
MWKTLEGSLLLDRGWFCLFVLLSSLHPPFMLPSSSLHASFMLPSFLITAKIVYMDVYWVMKQLYTSGSTQMFRIRISLQHIELTCQ